jgi:hypothetical protein
MKGSQESLTTVVIKGWPTPAARDHKDAVDNVDMEKVALKFKLSGVVAMHGRPVPASSSMPGSRQESWQTATVSTGAHKQKDGSMTDKLDQQVKSWATPRAEHDSGAHKGKPDTLHSQIKTWPTPASSGVTGGPTGLAGGAGNREKLAKMLPDAEARAMGCGKLNPRWVETLMGLPVGWTMPSCASPVTIERMNSDYSVTVLSQQQQNEPSGV